MAVEPLSFANPQAYSSFDFSPLMQLGQALNRQQGLGDLGQRYNADGSPTTPNMLTGGSSYARAPYSGDKQAVAGQITKELRAQGFSEPAIAGILYNVGQESGFDPTLRHPDQPRFGGEAHYAHGLFQEGGDEWNAMAAHLQPRNANWQDPVEQARFVAGRLKGDIGNAQYADVLRALQAAKTPEEAAKIFARGYLKPADRYLSSRIMDINRGIPAIGFYTGE
jgi:hypothetical protein